MVLQLPKPDNQDGEPRKTGLELEFTGLDLKETAAIIQHLFGGDVVEANRYQYLVNDTELGHFEVELDARILKKMAGTDFFKKWNLDIDEQKIKDSIGDVLDKLAKAVVPLEIVMPPLPSGELEKLETLRVALLQEMAEGTESSWMHAFGLHINIEVPDLETGTLVRYLKSFFILYPWLLEELDIDISRRLSPFIDHFPDEYVLRVLDPKYDPAANQLVEDYLEYNSTRNRPLDMMPILAMLDEEPVRRALKGEKNKPRPTFHYRLPNSRVDDPDWSFLIEWHRWLHVERLAWDDEMLKKLSKLYLLRERERFVSFRKEWAKTNSILLDLDEE